MALETYDDRSLTQQTSECLLQPEASYVYLALSQPSTGQMGKLRLLESKTLALSPIAHQASISGGLSVQSCLPTLGLRSQSRRDGFSHDSPSLVAHGLFLLPRSSLRPGRPGLRRQTNWRKKRRSWSRRSPSSKRRRNVWSLCWWPTNRAARSPTKRGPGRARWRR